jgi:hypothetical protein
MALTVPTYCSPCGSAFIAQKSCAALRCAIEKPYSNSGGSVGPPLTGATVCVAGGRWRVEGSRPTSDRGDRPLPIHHVHEKRHQRKRTRVGANPTAPHTSSAAHATGANPRTHIVSGGRDRLFCALAFGGCVAVPMAADVRAAGCRYHQATQLLWSDPQKQCGEAHNTRGHPEQLAFVYPCVHLRRLWPNDLRSFRGMCSLSVGTAWGTEGSNRGTACRYYSTPQPLALDCVCRTTSKWFALLFYQCPLQL